MKLGSPRLWLAFCLSLLLISGIASAAPQETPPSPNTLSLCATDDASSQKSKLNDLVHFKTTEQKTLSDGLVIPAQTILTGTITRVEKSGGWGCPGKMDITFTEIPGQAGQKLHFQGVLNVKGKEPNTLVKVSLLGGLSKGKPALIKAGDNFTLTLTAVPPQAQQTDATNTPPAALEPLAEKQV